MTDYKLPPISAGDIVTWYPDGEKIEANGLVAICAQVQGESVLLKVIEPGRSNFLVKECVRHVTHPFLQEHRNHKTLYGAWDYSPQMKRLMALEAALSDLTKSKGK